jgi:hypothetical protein
MRDHSLYLIFALFNSILKALCGRQSTMCAPALLDTLNGSAGRVIGLDQPKDAAGDSKRFPKA